MLLWPTDGKRKRGVVETALAVVVAVAASQTTDGANEGSDSDVATVCLGPIRLVDFQRRVCVCVYVCVLPILRSSHASHWSLPAWRPTDRLGG